VVVPDSAAGEAFAAALAESIAAVRIEHPMLTPAMAEAHEAWLTTATAIPGATGVAPGKSHDTSAPGELLVEHFGPTTVIATAGLHSYPKILQRLEGTLTATLLGTAAIQRFLRPVALQGFGFPTGWDRPPGWAESRTEAESRTAAEGESPS
jgi:hypothetical protein